VTRAGTLVEIASSGIAGGSNATSGNGSLFHVAVVPSLEVSSAATAKLVPEPSILALLGVRALGSVGYDWRRRS